jgi:hypothetical protein
MEVITMMKNYVKMYQDIEGNPIPEGMITELDPALDREVFEWLEQEGIPCDENGNEIK